MENQKPFAKIERGAHGPESIKLDRDETIAALQEMLKDPSLNDDERLKVDNEIMRLHKEREEGTTIREQAA